MKTALTVLAAGSAFFVTVLAATKASVSDHWFWYLRASYFLGFGFVVVAIWLSLSSKQKEKWWQFFRSIFRASLVAVLLALGSLPLVKLFVNPWLVSNRSYGSVLGAGWCCWGSTAFGTSSPGNIVKNVRRADLAHQRRSLLCNQSPRSNAIH